MKDFITEHANFVAGIVFFIILCIFFQFYKQHSMSNEIFSLRRKIKKLQNPMQSNIPVSVNDLHLEDKIKYKNKDNESYADSYMDPAEDF